MYALTPDGQQRVAEWIAEVSRPRPDLAELHLNLVAAASAGPGEPLSGFVAPSPRLPAVRELPDGPRTTLPVPDPSRLLAQDPLLAQVMKKRRSRWKHGTEPISVDQLVSAYWLLCRAAYD